jgi:hypothetical protein
MPGGHPSVIGQIGLALFLFEEPVRPKREGTPSFIRPGSPKLASLLAAHCAISLAIAHAYFA